uniref:Uncharacterized protein n=1 Tax=Acrobeloides nanus TaxID=290746 RepID=A0A914E7U2_9BILA
MWKNLVLLFILQVATANEPYCYNVKDPANSRLERCPPNGWFNYYDCCNDNYRCCNNFRWFLLIVFIVPWLLLLISLIAVLVGYSRKRKSRRNETQQGVYSYGNPNRGPIQRGTQVITVDIPDRKY